MDYVVLKAIHQTAVVLSVAGFAARGAASLAGAGWVRWRAARTVPHVVDTVLLLSALMLLWTLRLNPLATPWLAAKIVALIVYIALGTIALRPQLPLVWRAGAWLLALGTFGYMLSVAITKSPLGFFPMLTV